MRNTVFLALVVVICSCSPTEKTHTPGAPPVIGQKMGRPSADTLYAILDREGYGTSNPHKVIVSVISEHLVDASSPDAPTDFIVALVQVNYFDSIPRHDVSLAVFDAAKNMKLVAVTSPDFPDTFTYYDNNGERPSGQGPNMVARALRLSNGGEAIAVRVKSEKQYIQGKDDDEDVWLYALWHDEIVMLMGYSEQFTHLLTGDDGYSRTSTSDTDFIVGDTKTKGMADIILKTVANNGESEDTTTELKYVFNGKEYIQD